LLDRVLNVGSVLLIQGEVLFLLLLELPDLIVELVQLFFQGLLVLLEGLELELEFVLFLLGVELELLVLFFRVLCILNAEEIGLLEVVEELDHLMGLLEVHFLIVHHLLQLLVLPSLHDLLEVPLKL
jgi:hypothetical protein